MLNIIKILLIIVAIYYIFNDISFIDLYYNILNYNLFVIFFTLLLTFSGFIVVAFRWRFLSKNVCSLKSSLESTFLCLGVNNMTPAKLGEIAKTFYLKKLYNYPVSKSIVLMLIERFFDVLLLAILLLFISYYVQVANLFIILSLIFFGIVTLLYILMNPKFILKLINLYFPKKIKKFSSNSLKTLVRISFKEWIVITIFSVILWFVYYLTTFYFIKYGTTFNLNNIEILIVFVFSAIGMALPSTPGGLGVYEAGIVFALSLYGIDKEEALSFAIILHMLQFIPTILVTLLLITKKGLNFNFKNLKF